MTAKSDMGTEGFNTSSAEEGATLRRRQQVTLTLAPEGADGSAATVHTAVQLPPIPDVTASVPALAPGSVGSADGGGRSIRLGTEPEPELRGSAGPRRWRRLWGEDYATRSRRRRAVKVVALIGGVLAAWALSVSPLLAASSVEVSGLLNVTPEQVQAAAGIGPGTPLLLVRPSEIEARLEATPWIRSAEVTRNFPDSISVRVVERAPVAAVQRGDSWVTVDADGRALQVTRVAPTGLPALAVADVDEVGDVWLTGQARQVAKVLGYIPPDWRTTLANWSVDDQGALRATLEGGQVLVFGSSARGQAKVAAAIAVIAHAGRDRGGVLDVRVPEVPVWRPSPD